MTRRRVALVRARRLHSFLASHLIGGAGLIAVKLSAAAGSHGYQCVAWVPGDGPARDALTHHDVPTRRYNLEGLKGNRSRLLLACAKVTPHLIGLSRPIVHVHGLTLYSLIRPALFAAGARVIVHVHIDPSPQEIEWLLKYPPNGIIACAKYIGARLQDVIDRKGLSLRVVSIQNSVDLDRFVAGDRRAARAVVGLSTDAFVVLMLANLAPHKVRRRPFGRLICWSNGACRLSAGWSAKTVSQRDGMRPISGRYAPSLASPVGYDSSGSAVTCRTCCAQRMHSSCRRLTKGFPCRFSRLKLAACQSSARTSRECSK